MLKSTFYSLLFLGCFLLLQSCVTTAGIGIDPGQEFVLGEQNRVGYRAELRNKGSVPITVKAVNRSNNSVQQAVTLQVGEKINLNVKGSENIYLINNGSRAASVKARLTKNVNGMRYQDIPE